MKRANVKLQRQALPRALQFFWLQSGVSALAELSLCCSSTCGCSHGVCCIVAYFFRIYEARKQAHNNSQMVIEIDEKCEQI